MARVQSNLGTRCTGALVAPRLVLTAAHCLINKRTRSLAPADSLHVLFGYARGEYRTHLTVTSYTVSRLYDAREPLAAAEVDWALLRLAGDPGVEGGGLAVVPGEPDAGAPVALGGFNQDRGQIITADSACHVTARIARPSRQILHDCAATFGASGAPLLARRGADWVVVGMNIGSGRQGNVALATTAFAEALAREIAR